MSNSGKVYRVDEALLRIGQRYRDGQWQEALQAYQDLEAKSKLTPQQSAEVVYNSAMIYKALGQLDEAKQWFKRLFNDALKQNHRPHETKALHALGRMAYEAGDYKEALKLFRGELRLWYSEMAHYFSGLSRNYLAQGRCFLQQGDLSEAAIYLRHAVTFAQTDRDQEAKGKALGVMAELHMKEQRPKEAIRQLKLAMSAYRQVGDPSRLTEIEEAIQAIEAKRYPKGAPRGRSPRSSNEGKTHDKK